MGGCNDLGILYSEGNGVEQDNEKAVELFQIACDGEDMSGCNNLGIMYENGNGVEQDYEKTIALYRQACKGGLEKSCQLANNLENK